MISAWAFRLGSYLLSRIRKIGKDTRFDDKREKFWSFLGFWLLQGITVWIVMLPSILFYSNKVREISVFSIVGIIVWFIGLVIEGFADFQKYSFINDINNKGKWINIGLWKYSRHPNYFGEIMLWIGVYIFTLTGLSVLQGFIGLIGPLYIATLIIFVSGIPLLEKSAENKWGDNKEFQEYKKQTSVLLILPKLK
jgi:steroid 5-alpha reductase family enzyme